MKNKSKEKYVSPTIEVIELEQEDIIRTSATVGDFTEVKDVIHF